MAQLLLELFSEEIPARMQRRAGDDLARLVSDGLKAADLTFENAAAYATPRRLVLVVDGLPETQPDMVEEKRGPKVDAPDKAIEGFLKANGIARDQCEERETDKGTFLYAVFERKGQATAQVLPGILTSAIDKLPWAKSMRWGTGRFRWVRPLQRILSVLDGTVLALEVGDGIPCGNVTTGHRFHDHDEIEVGFFKDYAETLYLNKVIVDPAERRRVIAEGAAQLAAKKKFTVKDDPALLDEVTGLVEWPVPLMGEIDASFMTLPDEVLETSMRAHQKYFSVLFEDGKMAPRFIAIANIETGDGGEAIVKGNERVLRARLSDAKFFWDQDRKQSLQSRVPALADIVFHEKLGTMEDKVTRIGALAAELSGYIKGCDRDLATSAARLCKADLTTGMVGEFPELQGVMGRYYALEEGEKEEVADAIAEHYSPAGPGDDCPTAPVSVAVALADKIDTLIGFWAIDEKPTGSRDPFALRRAALGVIRLVLENGIRLPLKTAFGMSGHGDRQTIADDLLEFFADRLKVHLREKGVRHDLISAVFALGGEDDLVRLMARVDALGRFLETDDGANLLVAYRRASNIVAIEEKNDKADYGGEVDNALLAEADEKALVEALGQVSGQAAPAVEKERFDDAMEALSRLRGPVDAFFDKVTVNCDDAGLRANRLRLLSKIRAAMNEIADFSQIEGGEGR